MKVAVTTFAFVMGLAIGIGATFECLRSMARECSVSDNSRVCDWYSQGRALPSR